jgi:chromosome segregation ATPase
MSRQTLVRFARRVLVLGATVAVIGVAAGTVQLAAQWRSDSASLDTAPVGVTTISDDYAAQAARAADLAAQMQDVAKQTSDLKDALMTAGSGVGQQNESAAQLADQLAAAKQKLDAMQAQLKGAQDRLTALNKAAAQQAALNRAAAAAARSRPAAAAAAAPAAPAGEPGD